MPKKMLGLSAAISLLDCFTIEKPELRLTDISLISGHPKANAFRYLNALVEAELVRRDRLTKKYSLSFKILKFADIVSKTTSLQQVALPYMQKLRDLFNETVSLHIVDGNYGICIERQISNSEILHLPHIGVKNTLNAGSSRKVLLAYMPAKRIQEIVEQGFEKYTENTITDSEVLLAELQKIRDKGYSTSSGEKNTGVNSIAVPIWHGKTVIGSLSIGGSQFRVTQNMEASTLTQLQEASKKISKELC